MTDFKRTLPEITPETRHFWEGTRVGELLLQRCRPCANIYFPPRPFCPKCGSRSIDLLKASGRATLHSYVINHLVGVGESPYSVAVVELDEGPRMMTNIVGSAQTPEALRIDMALEVLFTPVGEDIVLPLFKPLGAS